MFYNQRRIHNFMQQIVFVQNRNYFVFDASYLRFKITIVSFVYFISSLFLPQRMEIMSFPQVSLMEMSKPPFAEARNNEKWQKIILNMNNIN